MNQETAEKIANALERIAATSERHVEAVEAYSEFEKKRAIQAEKAAADIQRKIFGGPPFGAPPTQPPATEAPTNISGPAGPPGARRRRG